jgi:hypothetical protein
MVPGHPFNEMKPNSGDAAVELARFTAKVFAAQTGAMEPAILF